MTTKWPPANGLGTPTVPREQAVLVSNASKLINAPASLVFDILCDTSTYPDWNSFVPRVTIHSQPSGTPADSPKLVKGTSFTYHVVMNAAKPTQEQPTQLVVTDVSTPTSPSNYISSEVLAKDDSYTADLQSFYRISWKTEGSFVARGLQTERFHEIIERGDKECEVRTWEVMGGMLAYTVKWFYKDTLAEKFWIWCEELKKVSEDKAAKQV
ncbi:hypothetical protein EJ08DRAFT_650208 [Tothia fuscella]|uniref:Coenzyme Q-binding protein COQ10 START domain-containing protein n=1 Tax=Tothia fuscella TaxID=1048955 RepID=A0A9P4TXZ1_9PEZI|nr:hypothetical protein EJ08DRAFT_650208 [Tothia fuscella]